MKRELTLTLMTDGERVNAIDVRLPRFDATALLGQRPASEVAVLLPSLFSICAQAQAAAAAAAIGAACGRPLSPVQIAGHTLAVQIESVQESLRSLCLGLPGALLSRQTAQGAEMIAEFSQAWRDGTAFLARLQKALRDGTTDEAKAFATLIQEAKAIAQAWDHFCARYVYGSSVLSWKGEENNAMPEGALPVMRWLQRMEDEVPRLGETALSPLPLAMFRAGKLPWRALVEMPYDASVWWRVQQDPRMSPVAARFGNSIVARSWARLVDVARTLSGLLDAATKEEKPWVRVHSLGDGEGMAEVECARGVLMHRAQLAEQNVVAYDVCAPTDWNLHRDGALATLVGLPATDVERLRTRAIWLVQVLDPCVVFSVEVTHA